MRIDLLARRWGGPDGGPDGMAVASAFLAWTLAAAGHEVRCCTGASPPWQRAGVKWTSQQPLSAPPDWTADLVITTIQAAWRRTVTGAEAAGARSRLCYWHHHSGLPPGYGCLLAAPPAIAATADWGRAVVLPPSSWAAELGGEALGDAILVPGGSALKGARVALAVAQACPDLRWYVLPGRASEPELAPWRRLPRVDVASGQVAPSAFLARARAVLLPTRVEVHPLVLVEAAVRGIPIVCSDSPACRAATGGLARYVPADAQPATWATALREALAAPPERLRLRPYGEVVSGAIAALLAPGLSLPPLVRSTGGSRPRGGPLRYRQRIETSPPAVRSPDLDPGTSPPSGRWIPPARGDRPRVLILADVPNWAWGRKARSLLRCLSDRFDVEVVYSTDRPGAKIRERAHDLYHTFEVIQVGSVPIGFPLVTGITAHVAHTWEKQHGAGTVRRWADRAKAFHANSRMLQREMETLIGRPVYYCPNGVDEDFWIRTRPRESARMVVGHVARPSPRKGQEIVREACRRVGVELRTIDRTSHNALSPEAMRDFYQGIHVLAVSSDMDGTPNPALEAASCECAVVSNRIGNMPEFLDGKNGLLTERTLESLTVALGDLAARPLVEVEAMGLAARQTILDGWTWARQSEHYAAMWMECLR